MLFHSFEFLAFFSVVYPVYLLVRRTGLAKGWLLLSSYVFYAGWNPAYLPLIILTTMVDFYAAQRIEAGAHRKAWLALSLSTNLSVLGFFKYAKFFTENLNGLLGLAGVSHGLPVVSPILPLGISFFTFQSMSYAIDVYRGEVAAERRLLVYALYVSFFPQMVSGPICRAAILLPQMSDAPPVRLKDASAGASLFLMGLFKKVAVADALGMYVDRVYGTPEAFRAPALALATFAFSWQIYFDFSGYTDMARGVARAMGYHLTQNFNAPYAAADLGKFWGRWNITVSNWFRDYVYIPLGGNRRGHLRTSLNILATMVTSGVWHGASWTFILWGTIHGIGRVATRELGSLARLIQRMPPSVQRFGVFGFVTFAWIFFRARSLGDAALIVVRLVTTGWEDPRFPVMLLVPIAIVWAYQLSEEDGLGPRRLLQSPPVRVALATLMIGYLALVAQPSTQTFIYFNF